MTRNTWRHGEILIRVGALLHAYASSHPGWSVSGGDPGTKLSHDPDVLRGLDIGIARAERRPIGLGADGWLEGAPEVAVEILGDARGAAHLSGQALEYLAAGSKLVWVFDASVERVMVFTPPDHIRVLGRDDTLDGGDTLPGFSCQVRELFR